METTATVLLVDDDPGIVDTAAAFVGRASDALTTTTATGPEAALNRFEDEDIDCIVSDYDMPKMDGLALFEAVSERDGGTPFILFTGKGSEEVAGEAISLGVTDYLQKETGTEQYEVLANRIENAIEASRAEQRLERYERMVETVDDALYTVDSEGRFTSVNDAFVTLTGYDRDALIGSDVSVLKEAATVERFETAVSDMLGGDHDETYIEFDLPTAEGERIPCEDHMTLRTDDGEYAGVAGTIRDLTERRRRERALERYETAIETAPVGVVVLDAGGTITWCNERADSFFGYTAGDLAGEPFRSLVMEETVPEDAIDEYVDVLRSLLSADNDRTAGEFETTITPPGEERRTLRIRVSLLPYDEAFEGAVVVCEDITERKQRERDLERERERFATLFENIPDPSVLAALDGEEPTVASVNEGFEDTFGYEADTAVGEPLNDLIVPPEEREEAQSLDQAAIDGERLTREVTRRTDAGERREFLFSNATIDDDDDGDADVAFGVYTDITAQKRRERVLADLHERTREMMATADPDAVAEIAVETAGSVLGLPMCGLWLVDDDADRLVPAADAGRDDAMIEEMPTYEPGNSLSWECFAAGETRIYDDLRGADAYDPETPLRSEMILPLGEYGVMNIGSTTLDEFDDTDVAFARLLATNVEAALERAEREQERAARKRLLEQQNERLEEFASVVSHDLRNPLTVANGRLALLEENCESPHIQSIDDALARMDDLIEECLTFARQGQVVIDPAQVNLDDSVERAWATVETGDAELALGDLGTVEADEERLRTLFENLFRNAIEHGDAATVRVGSLDAHPGFYVADDGSGIPDEEREAVFDRGYSTNENGTGLGLAIVETLADAHGWDIVIADEGSGTRFEVAFEPAAPLAAPQLGG
jgi:PAS domain S-box-containing protein